MPKLWKSYGIIVWEPINENIIVNLDSEQENIIIDPADDYYGSGYITVTISEAEGDQLSISQTFNIDVLPVNDSPVLSSISDGSVELGNTYTYQVNATDIDNTVLSYSLSGGPSDLTIDGNGFLDWSPSDIGEHNVTVEVSDGSLSDSQSFNLSAYVFP